MSEKKPAKKVARKSKPGTKKAAAKEAAAEKMALLIADKLSVIAELVIEQLATRIAEKVISEIAPGKGGSAGSKDFSATDIAFESAFVSANPSWDEIKWRVIPVIDREAEDNGAPVENRALLNSGDESVDLDSQLFIGATRRNALSVDYSKISTDYQGGKSVTGPAAEAAKTVEAVIKLVHRRANGK